MAIFSTRRRTTDPFAQEIRPRLRIRDHGDHSVWRPNNSIQAQCSYLQSSLARRQIRPARAAASCLLVSDSNGSRRELLLLALHRFLWRPARGFLHRWFLHRLSSRWSAAVLGAAAFAMVLSAPALCRRFRRSPRSRGGGVAGFAAGFGRWRWSLCCRLRRCFRGVAGADWACKLLPAVASRIPVITVMARRMARSSCSRFFTG